MVLRAYNRCMARGWDSKAVEDQIESAQTESNTSKNEDRNSEDAEVLRHRQGLELNRARVVQQLEQCENPRYRQVLENALADLDSQLKK